MKHEWLNLNDQKPLLSSFHWFNRKWVGTGTQHSHIATAKMMSNKKKMPSRNVGMLCFRFQFNKKKNSIIFIKTIQISMHLGVEPIKRFFTKILAQQTFRIKYEINRWKRWKVNAPLRGRLFLVIFRMSNKTVLSGKRFFFFSTNLILLFTVNNSMSV